MPPARICSIRCLSSGKSATLPGPHPGAGSLAQLTLPAGNLDERLQNKSAALLAGVEAWVGDYQTGMVAGEPPQHAAELQHRVREAGQVRYHEPAGFPGRHSPQRVPQ